MYLNKQIVKQNKKNTLLKVKSRSHHTREKTVCRKSKNLTIRFFEIFSKGNYVPEEHGCPKSTQSERRELFRCDRKRKRHGDLAQCVYLLLWMMSVVSLVTQHHKDVKDGVELARG
jgi:hypothetical protein